MLVTGKGVMDWEIKLDQEDNTLFSFQVGSSYSGKQNNNGGFPMCLKLGTSDTPTMLVSPSGSLKRTRRPNGTPNVLCSVDGCKSDLRNCKSYHRRHRVCEHHSKAPVVTVGGQEQRFCQQCSRFHSLGEFDEVKRSCRKRLDGHNRRRRKSHPASSYVNSQSFLSKQLGTRILQFSNPQVCATSTVRNPSCLVFAKGKAEAMIYNGQQQWHVVDQQSLPNSSSCICNEESKPFNLLPATVPKISYETVPAVYICQPLCNSTASPEKRSSNGMLSNGKTQSVDSNCAFFLLSTHPTQASGISLSHLVQSNATHPIAEFPRSHSMLNEHFGSVLIPYANQTNNDCNGMLHVGADSLSGYGAIRKLPIL